MFQRRARFGLADEAELLFLIDNKMEGETLQGDPPVEAGIAGQIDDTHSTRTQPGNDFVVAERPAYECVGHSASHLSCRCFKRRRRKEAASMLVRSQQLFHVAPQGLVSTARGLEKGRPIFGLDFERLFQQSIDLAPPFGLHHGSGLSS
jgi:hypothetical protein